MQNDYKNGTDKMSLCHTNTFSLASDLKIASYGETSPAAMSKKAVRPKILFVADVPGWAFDFKITNIIRYLGVGFDCRKRYLKEVESGDIASCDMVALFYWNYIEYGILKTLINNSKGRLGPRVLFGVCSHQALQRLVKENKVDLVNQSATAIFINSKLLYKEAIDLFNVPIFYTPNGVDTRFFVPPVNRPQNDALVVGWAGSLKVHNKIRDLENVVIPAIQSLKNVTLVTAAREDKWRSHSEMRDFYHQLDVYICASVAETGPNPCLEAAACGVPVVTTRVGNMPELIQHGVNGLFIERDVSDIVQKLTLLRDNPTLRQQMGQNIRKSIEDWDWKNNTENYRFMLQSVWASMDKPISNSSDSKSDVARPVEIASSIPSRSRILFIVDVPGWAHDFKTDNIIKQLGSEFDCQKRYCDTIQADDIESCDLVVIYYWRQLKRGSMKDLTDVLERNKHKILLGICSHQELQEKDKEKGFDSIRQYASGIFVNSRLLNEQYGGQFAKPVFYTPNGVDTNFFTPSAETRRSQKMVVGWAGSLKNHHKENDYAEYIAPVIQSLDGVELITAIREEKWRSHSEMLDFYRQLDVYLCASEYEGTPNPCLEAAACGVPVVTTRVGNMPDLIRDGVNGLFIERDVNDIVQKLTHLRDNPALRQQIGQNIRKSIAVWDWKKNAENYRLMFRSALASIKQKNKQICEAKTAAEDNSFNEVLQAIKLFQQAQKTYVLGNMVSARRLMAQYQAQIDYSKLPAIDRRNEQTRPLMSVIIVTWRRTEDLVKLLDRLAGQTCRDFETIVIDNGGTDVEAIMAKADCIVPCPINFNLSEGRNIGTYFARGQIAVFLDDDALIDADYTASIPEAFRTCHVLGLRGKTLPKTPSANETVPICDRGDTPFPTICNQEGNSAFLLWAWRAVGGQDPLLFGHEGTDLTWRLMQAFGRSDVVMYWPKTVIYHDYGNAGKFRKKQNQHELNRNYLSYKYEKNIADIRLAVEKLPLPQGDALALQPSIPARAKQWHSLCYTDNREKIAAVPGPKVSIILACFNTAEYLPQCLDGILAQTLTDWETILVDDGSTDGTREILQRYAQKDKRFRVYLYDRSEGPYVRRNFAIQQAYAPFVSIQDADDILAPVKLELMLEEILRDDSLAVVGSFFGRFIDTFRGPEYCDRIKLKVSHQEIMTDFQHSWYVSWHASAIIRKDMFYRVGMYDTQPWGSDTFWLSKAAVYGMLTGKARFKNIPEVLTYKREHRKSQTGTILLNHPRGRRKVLSQYGRQMLANIINQSRQNPAYDVVRAIQECNCNDFIPRFGHLFEQWESSPVTDEMILRLLSKAVSEFVSRYYTDSLISLNSLCSVCVGIDKKIQGLNLLRGLCQFVAGEDESTHSFLRQEYQDHETVWAMQFLNMYLAPGKARPAGLERREIVDNYVFAGPKTQESKAEILYDNRNSVSPEVSVILDCRQGEVDLGAVLAEWTAQTDTNLELLILTAGNRKEDLAGLNLPLPTAVVNMDRGTSNAAAKNKAVPLSRGRILLFVSGDVSVQPDCVHTVREAMKTSAAGAISGRIKSAQHIWNPAWNYGDRMIFCSLDQDMLCAVRRRVFEQTGGVDEGLWAREMLSLSWRIYSGLDTEFGSILYVPQLQGTRRAETKQSTDYLLRIVAGDQLYWRQSAPAWYSVFMSFTENCFLNTDTLPEDRKAVVGQITQFFMSRHNAVALQWARYANRLNPGSLAGMDCLANCEWNTGNHDAAAEWFEKIQSSSFAEVLDSRMFNADEQKRYADAIRCYISSCLRLAEHHIDRGRMTQARQILDRLRANRNIVLDAEKQMAMEQLFQQILKTPDQPGVAGNASVVFGNPGPINAANSAVCPTPASRHQNGPLVSVIMPAYNAANYIEDAIQSVLAQSYKNIELVIINDGSTDDTEQRVQKYNDKRIRYYVQQNAGLSASRNAGIKRAAGELFVFLDHDDRMTPDFVARHKDAFENNPEVDLVYCDDLLMDEKGDPGRVITRKEYNDNNRLISDLFRHGFPVVPFRTCIRKTVFDKIGLFDESLRNAEDYDMIRRFVEHGLVAKHLPGAFYLRRIVTDSLSRNHTRQKAQVHFNVIKRFIDTFKWNQLFPAVNWERIAPEGRDAHGRYLAAMVFLAIGQNYVKTKSPAFFVEMALDFAMEQLDKCLELSPDDPQALELMRNCQQVKSQFMEVLV
jgi:glycosyltransferase involved in cell wall biosynthesis